MGTSNVLHKPASVASTYHDQMHQQWQQNPASVDESWRKYFEGGSSQSSAEILQTLKNLQSRSGSGSHDIVHAQSQASKVMTYIRNFMTYGHLLADIDPLHLEELEDGMQYHNNLLETRKVLDLKFYGFTEADLDTPITIKLEKH